MTDTLTHWIDGAESTGASTRTSPVFNPDRGEVARNVLLASARPSEFLSAESQEASEKKFSYQRSEKPEGGNPNVDESENDIGTTTSNGPRRKIRTAAATRERSDREARSHTSRIHLPVCGSRSVRLLTPTDILVLTSIVDLGEALRNHVDHDCRHE